MYAIKNRRHKSAITLIRLGANVNMIDRNGMTPTGYSIADGGGVETQFLLDHGADPNQKSKDGWSTLHNAIATHKENLISTIVKRGGDVNAFSDGRAELYTAAASGTLKTAELLLENGANPNIRTKEGGETPIFAAARQSKQMVKLLLDHGAKINAEDFGGRRAIDWVIYISKDPRYKDLGFDPSMIDFLKAHGAKPSGKPWTK